MALGKKCGARKARRGNVNGGDRDSELELELGFVKYTRGLGRKRILISNDVSDKSPLESLPQELLIRILCGVNHDDLEQLFRVSKAVREAAVIAKQWHFAYTTPVKTRAFTDCDDLNDVSELSEVAVNAPMQSRNCRRRISEKKLADISVALFASEEERWPKKGLLMEADI